MIADWLLPLDPASSFDTGAEFELANSINLYIDYKTKHPDTSCFTGSFKTVTIPPNSLVRLKMRPDVRFPFCYMAEVFIEPGSFRDSLTTSWGWRSKSGLGGYVDGRQLSSYFEKIDTTEIVNLRSQFVDKESGELEQLYLKYGITKAIMDSIEVESEIKNWKDDENIGFTDRRLPRNTLYYKTLKPQR